MKKVMYGWTAEPEKVQSGMLSCVKNGRIKWELQSVHLKKAGIFIDPYRTYIYFDDKEDNTNFLFNNKELPDWVKPLILSQDDVDRIPQGLDGYTMECVRDLIYWWFEYYCHKKLTQKRKERIAKLVGLHFNRKRYSKFINYGFNHKAHLEYDNKWVEDFYGEKNSS